MYGKDRNLYLYINGIVYTHKQRKKVHRPDMNSQHAKDNDRYRNNFRWFETRLVDRSGQEWVSYPFLVQGRDRQGWFTLGEFKTIRAAKQLLKEIQNQKVGES